MHLYEQLKLHSYGGNYTVTGSDNYLNGVRRKEPILAIVYVGVGVQLCTC